MNHQNQNKHTPVLLRATLKYLDPNPGESYLDLTAGYGGHAKEIRRLTLMGPTVLVDRDKHAISYLRAHVADKAVKILHQDFLTAGQKLLEEGQQFDIILADLGVSSPHFNIASRGFSITNSGPLDMRMDQRQTLTANDIVNGYDQKELADIIRRWGEEPRAKRIAKTIVDARPIKSTTELAEIVSRSLGGRRGKTAHPATRTFQAIRITVNNELELLKSALPVWLKLLKPEGRIAVISFHSLEDRIVKQAMVSRSGHRYDAEIQLLTKRPITADKNELAFNPRARSAKLRAAVKIKT